LLLIAVFTAGERSQPQSTSLSSWYRIELIRSTVRSACAYSWLLELPDGSDRGEILYRSGAWMLTDCAGEGVEVDGGGPAGGGSCQVRFSVITHRPCPLVTFTVSPTPTAFAVGDRYATFDSPPMLTRQRPALLGSVSTCPWYWRWSVRSCCCPVACWARAPAREGGAFRVDTSRTIGYQSLRPLRVTLCPPVSPRVRDQAATCRAPDTPARVVDTWVTSPASRCGWGAMTTSVSST